MTKGYFGFAAALLLLVVPLFVVGDNHIDVDTGRATSVTFNSARLEGDIDPEGAGPTAYWFEWGPTDALGRITPRSTNPQINEFEASYQLTGLNPDTKYYYRLGAEVPLGQAFGNIKSFSTEEFEDVYEPKEPECDDDFDNDFDGLTDLKDPDCKSREDTTERPTLEGAEPKAETIEGTAEGTGVVLKATITLGRAAATEVWFEWGPTEETDFRTAVRTRSEFPFFALSETLRGLKPRTTYYYRSVAVNQYGSSRGAIEKIQTGRALKTQESSKTVVSPQESTLPSGSGSSFPTPGVEDPVPEGPLLISKEVANLSFPSVNTTRNVTEASESDIILFTIFADNLSDESVAGVIVQDVVPSTLIFIEASPVSIYNKRTGRIIWWIRDLKSFSSETLSFAARARSSSKNELIENTAILKTEHSRGISNKAFAVIHTERDRTAKLAQGQETKKATYLEALLTRAVDSTPTSRTLLNSLIILAAFASILITIRRNLDLENSRD